MRTEPLGQMANAPLALVLAQVRISPYLTIGNSVPAIQDTLRSVYPVYRKGQMQTLEISFGANAPKISTLDRHQLVDAENRVAFVIQQDSIVFMATRYKTFEDFEEKHRVVLDCIQKHVKDVFVEGLGLRYVDVIVPRENERPEQYVVDGLTGCAVDTFEAAAFQSQYVAHWRLKDGGMTFRFTNGARPPFLPPDIQPLELGIPEIVQRAAAASEKTTRIGLFDFDRVVEYRGSYDSGQVSKLFSGMHADHSTAFKGAMRELAEDVWNSKNA